MALLSLFPAPALAETLVVRSGEHETFTRFVTRVPGTRAWQVKKSGASVTLTVPGDNVHFDVSAVFDRIPRDRVRGLNQNQHGGTLQLFLACNCDVRSFEEAGGYVVIDILDSTESPLEQDRETQENTDIFTLDRVLPLGNLGTTLARLTQTDPDGSGNTERPDFATQPAEMQVPKSRDFLPEPAAATRYQTQVHQPPKLKGGSESDTVAQAERQLRKQITRAAAQGLVEIQPSEEQVTELSDSLAGDVSDASSLAVRAVTSVDRDMEEAASLSVATGNSRPCLTKKVTDVASWGDDRPFGDQIGDYRVRLAGEFDKLSPKGTLALAKTYMFFGFGAEAKILLESLPGYTSNLSVLISIAQLMNDQTLATPNPLKGQSHCDGPVALWAFLAHSVVSKDEIDSKAVARAFLALPAHLRRHLGPDLVRRFADIGDDEAADLLLRSIERVEFSDDPSLRLAKANLARLTGKQETADEIIEDVAYGGNRYSAEALVSLVNRKFEMREPVSADDLKLLESYLFEFRASELEAGLRRAYATALALSDDYLKAYGMAEGLATPQKRNTIFGILALATENADDLTFLQIALGSNLRDFEPLPEAEIRIVARRLIELGFPDEAIKWSESGGRVAKKNRFSLLRAKAFLDLGLPQRSLLEISRESSNGADRIRAEALQKLGSHSRAATLFSASEEPENAARSAWLATDPLVLTDPVQTTYGAKIAAQSRLMAPQESVADVTLAQARNLLTQAERMRRDIDVLSD
ncbi:MAG: hypothetical protein ACWA49_12135 [Ruegeria sp.]